MKKLTIIVLLFVSLTLAVNAQRKTVNLPDLPGYVTLKCDFHMHSVFSDGNVWPIVRVDEALRDGLDVIAITDHIEYPKRILFLLTLMQPGKLQRDMQKKEILFLFMVQR
jgi:hypothetical protein